MFFKFGKSTTADKYKIEQKEKNKEAEAFQKMIDQKLRKIKKVQELTYRLSEEIVIMAENNAHEIGSTTNDQTDHIVSKLKQIESTCPAAIQMPQIDIHDFKPFEDCRECRDLAHLKEKEDRNQIQINRKLTNQFVKNEKNLV